MSILRSTLITNSLSTIHYPLFTNLIMFPIDDDNPTRITPFVTYGLIALNVLIFVYELTLPEAGLTNFFYQWAIVPAQFTGAITGNPAPILPVEPPEILTLISSQFLHGGFAHVAGNMLFLWIFGNNVEDQLGHVKFLLFYLACGVLAGLTQWFFSQSSGIPSLGASGAIAGVMGAYIIRFPNVSVKTVIPIGIFPLVTKIPAYFYLGIWFFQQALYSFATLAPRTNVGMESGGVAYWAHAGGFVFGALLGPLLGLFSQSSET
jgi:membrane associated rhomboid family serine protease